MTKINSSLKILHILDHSLPLHSGYSFRSHNIFKAQIKKGWQPVILTSPKHEESWKGEWNAREEIDGLRYYRSGCISTSSVPFKKELHLLYLLKKRICEVAEIERPDIVHAHSPILNVMPALRIGHKLGIPVIYEIRAFWEDAAVDHGSYQQNSWKYNFVKFIETKCCRKADQIVALCSGLKNDLIQRGIHADKISIVSNAINPDDFKDSAADSEYMKTWKLEGKKVIGFIGSFYRYEGLNLLIEAFSQLAIKNPNVLLLLVGGGEMETELKDQAARLNLLERIIMPGRIDHGRVPGIYALIDILVYPRYSMRLTELVTPLKPLEAMSMNKAVVASDIGGHREFIKDEFNGLLFPAGDALALVRVLRRILNDSNLRNYISEQGRDWVSKQFLWEKTTAAYIDVYSKSLDALQSHQK